MSGSAYVIFGKSVKPHQLAIATLSTLVGGLLLNSLGSKPAPAAPPIQASSPEEEDFIGKYLKELEEKK